MGDLMETLRTPKRTLGGTILRTIPVILMFYFVYHIFQGERGLLSMLRLQKQLTTDERILNELALKKQTIEKQVALLRPDNLDLDMLEERVRSVLQFARPSELIIQIPPETILEKKDS